MPPSQGKKNEGEDPFSRASFLRLELSEGKRMEGKEKYQCQGSATCGFIYDPERGDRKGKVPKGVPFEQLPEDWRCPCCGVGKDKFQCIDEA
jgi:rubredoxin